VRCQRRLLDRAALVDDHLDQLVHDVGGVPYRAFTQRASLASEGKPAVVVADHARCDLSIRIQNLTDSDWTIAPA
jgi:hypothetical protein